MTYTRDIARGMVYLTCKGFVHRDLAARNILVTADKTCKVNSYVVYMQDNYNGHNYCILS